jgi:hypothetical protein
LLVDAIIIGFSLKESSTDLIFFHLFLNENSSQQEVCQLSAFDFNFKLIVALGIPSKALTVAYISSMTV